MRKPRDYDAELKALDDKARRLKARRVQQLGELVIACGAGALTSEQLAGALIAAKDATASTKEGWRVRGVAFFLQTKRKGADRAAASAVGTAQDDGGAASS